MLFKETAMRLSITTVTTIVKKNYEKKNTLYTNFKFLSTMDVPKEKGLYIDNKYLPTLKCKIKILLK